jgi:hypothetical protein
MSHKCVGCLFVLLFVSPLLGPGFSGRSLAADTPAKGRLFFIGVAYDEAPPKGKTGGHFNYAPDNFSDLLTELSKDLFTDIRVSTLKNKQVTHDGVMAHLEQIKKTVKKDDLVFFYWGTHGGTDATGWGANGADGSSFKGREFKELFATFNCPVIVAISTCGSGGFAVPSAKDVAVPDNVGAFCACRRQKTTGNQLDVAMCEGLAGFADLDNDGLVTLREMIEYVPRRYHEWTPDEKTRTTDDLPVLSQFDKLPLDRALTKASPNRLSVVKDGMWYGALKVDKSKNKTTVRFLGYDHTTKDGGYSMPNEAIADADIDLPGGPPPAMVEWKGTWYPSVLLERNPKTNEFKVHYVGYPDSDDEVVARSRVRMNFGVRTFAGIEVKK